MERADEVSFSVAGKPDPVAVDAAVVFAVVLVTPEAVLVAVDDNVEEVESVLAVFVRLHGIGVALGKVKRGVPSEQQSIWLKMLVPETWQQ